MMTRRRPPRLMPGHFCLAAFVVALFAMGGLDAAPLVLQANETLDSGTFTLTWSGGTLPYKTVAKMGTPKACMVQSFSAAGLTQLSIPVNATDGTTFYVLSDSTSADTPTVSITPPNTPTTASRVTVTGFVSPSGQPVCVNNLPATVTGTSFSIDVPLALGTNALAAWTSQPNGNTQSATSQVTRNVLNHPPSITISRDFDDCDTTPVLFVNFSDPDGAQLDYSSFRAILNGTNVTSSYMGSPTFPTPTSGMTGVAWAVLPAQKLAIGTNVLRVTIADTHGSAAGDTYAFFTNGPWINWITPRAALPNSTVTINGCGFSPTAGLNDVRFGGTPATSVTVIDSGTLNVVVPASITNDAQVTVTVNAVSSNVAPFDVAFTSVSTGIPGGHVAIDATDNVYYDGKDGCIRKVTPAGVPSSFVCFADEITGMQFDNARTTLYVSTRGDPIVGRRISGDTQDTAFKTGHIKTVTLAGTASNIITFPADGEFTDVSGITLDKNDIIYLAAVRLSGPTGGPWTPSDVVLSGGTGFTSALATFTYSRTRLIEDVAVDSLGQIYATWCPSDTNCNVYRGGAIVVQGGQIQNMRFSCNDNLFMTDLNFSEVLIRLPDGGVFYTANDYANPYGLDTDRNGNMYVSCSNTVRRDGHNQGYVFRDTACATDFSIYMWGDDPHAQADFDARIPAGPAQEVMNTQVTPLVVQFYPNAGDVTWDPPAFPPGTKALWQCYDPDDPATDPLVDPGVGDQDNTGNWDNALPFQAVQGYPMTGSSPGLCNGGSGVLTAIDAQGYSKIDFHYTDAPGDNFWVKSSLTVTKPTGTITRIYPSQTMTVWKRAKVETDSMGTNTGPFDANDDDALMGDIPDPDGGLLLSAFQQAYVDIVSRGPGTRTNVTFDPHVPDSMNSATRTQEVDAQGVKGRDFASNFGDWEVYVQGAYESGVEGDYDNDAGVTEGLPVLGISSAKYSLAFQETMRDVEASGFPSVCSHAFDEAYLRAAAPLHELGHAFGLGTDPGTCGGTNGIMDNDVVFPYFIGAQLRTMRTRQIVGN